MHELLEIMQRTCRESVTLIQDFVNNEFLESASVALKWERSDLSQWLGVVMEEYKRSEWHTHLQFDYAASPEPVYVNLDVNKFLQVVTNLLGNALKFTPDGGTIRVGLQQRGQQAALTVADTGIGIPKQLQPALFDKFTKARRPDLRGEKTPGLGMSVVNTIVELHGGRIHVESHEGKGTSFTSELPLA